MFIEVVTTITSRVPIADGGFGSPEHSAQIDGGDLTASSQTAVLAVVRAGCQATINAALGLFADDDTDDGDDVGVTGDGTDEG